MSLPVPPLPPSGRFIEHVRKSSRALTQAEAVTVSAHISIPISIVVVGLGAVLLVRAFCVRGALRRCNFIWITPRLIWHGRQREGCDMAYRFQPTTVFHVSLHHRNTNYARRQMNLWLVALSASFLSLFTSVVYMCKNL
jgi:hypothetical protein